MASGTLRLNGGIQLGSLTSNPANPLAGMIYYNSSAEEFRFYNGSGFVELADFGQLGATANGLGASLIGIEDAADNFAATDVEAALAELYDALGQAGATSFDEADFEVFQTGEPTRAMSFNLTALTQARSVSMPDTNVDLGDIASNASDIADLVSLSGVAANATNLGTFTGSTIPDSQNIKQALQALETEVELKADDSDLTSHTGDSTIHFTQASISITESQISDLDKYTQAEVDGLLDDKLDANQVGVADGVASLDSNGKVPISQLPNSIVEYKGTWNASTNTPTLANGAGNDDTAIGDVYRVTVAGTVDFGAGDIEFEAGDYVILNDNKIWERAVTSEVVAGVSSVNGEVGDVVLDSDDIDEGVVNLYFSDGRAQDAIGAMVDDSSKITLTYNDGVPSLVADIVAGSLVNADINAAAAIAYSKLNLSDSIVDADINASAAIAGSKISPDFGSQDVRTTGVYRQGASGDDVEVSYIHNETLTGSATNAVLAALSFDTTVYKSLMVEYTIVDNTSFDRRTGFLIINANNDDTVASNDNDIVDINGETGTGPGVSWDLNQSGNDLQVRYSTTANNKTLNARVIRFRT